ncbi:HD domain-containing phosphohydrolase [Marinobacter sediminum]|uniref:HD domain-containing phosphohydrolase n=1 Tax=Marinobacter sediminum TaxID=256323 RepID=UPI0035693846
MTSPIPHEHLVERVLPKVRLLLVDDEENILRSLQRSLRNEPYEVKTARSGEEALTVMGSQRIDLIISDARMPGLDGPTLLAKVKAQYPWCIRILLTGYTDITSTVKAINDGQIYRYIKKPWDDDELRLIIRQALAFQYSERRRKALEQLTQKQNQELQELNANLEDRVKSRTAELKETADMLDSAYKDLRQSYVTATEVFSTLLNKRLPADRQPNGKVVLLVKAYAEFAKLDADVSDNLAMAAALYNLGKLTWPDELFNTPSELLKKDQRLEFQKYPVTGEQLLMPLDQLKETATIIRHHQERWNGQGQPDELEANQIPFGSRLLKIAVDYTELQAGLVLSRKVSRNEAIQLIAKYRGRLYDPNLADQFLTMLTDVAPDIEPADDSVQEIDVLRLEPGMVLARNLYSGSGMLLLKEGKSLTGTLIDKLTAFERAEPDGHRYTLQVHRNLTEMETQQ